MTRSVYVHTCQGCFMPGIVRAMASEQFEKDAEVQMRKGRQKPEQTLVGRYIERKQKSVAKRLKRVLHEFAVKTAKKIAAKFPDPVVKAAGDKRTTLEELLASLDSDELGRELNGELTNAMQAAFRRASKVGLTQVGFDASPSIVRQLDTKARDYSKRRGGELIKDLAGTTREDMRALVSKALEEGMSADELAQAIEAMGAFGEARAEVIARTELAFAHVQGNVEGWKATGEVVGKRSILGDLHDYIDICDEAAEAGVVDLDDNFVEGADFPPYHPNCICDILPVLRGDNTEGE